MQPTHDKIRAIAYRLLVEQGRPLGSPEADWGAGRHACQCVRQMPTETEPLPVDNEPGSEVSDEDLAGARPANGQNQNLRRKR